MSTEFPIPSLVEMFQLGFMELHVADGRGEKLTVKRNSQNKT